MLSQVWNAMSIKVAAQCVTRCADSLVAMLRHMESSFAAHVNPGWSQPRYATIRIKAVKDPKRKRSQAP